MFFTRSFVDHHGHRCHCIRELVQSAYSRSYACAHITDKIRAGSSPALKVELITSVQGAITDYSGCEKSTNCGA